MSFLKLLPLFLGLSIVFAACSDDTETGDTDAGTTTDTGAADTGAGADVDTGRTYAWDEVPAVALESGDAAAVCPGAYATTAPVDGDNADYEAGGQTRSFHLQTPATMFTGPRPLVVGFHGTNGTGAGAHAEYELDQFVAAGFIALSPDGNDNGEIWPVWDALRQSGNEGLPNPDLDLFDSLIDCLGAHFEIDQNRIYILGQSAGGIMVNHVLQRRSDLLAGGIVASGVFDLTAPDPALPIDDMVVMVTWGGDDDEWGGTAEGGDATVPEINFVEQAAIASAFWEETEGVHQAYCYGHDLGHVYLGQLTDLFLDFFLSHPKGAAIHDDWTLEPPAESTQTTCSEDAVEYESSLVVECSTSSTSGCQDMCQYTADCTVENGTVAPVIGPQLAEIGFTDDDLSDCSGCLTTCEADVAGGGTVDQDVIDCMATDAGGPACGPGIPGAIPWINRFNACCEDQADSEFCTRMCESILTNDVARDFFDSCDAWAE